MKEPVPQAHFPGFQKGLFDLNIQPADQGVLFDHITPKLDPLKGGNRSDETSDESD